MPEIYIGIGSNVEREKHISSGLDMLAAKFGDLNISSVYESRAVGFIGAHFYNLAVWAEVELPISKLVKTFKEIEDANQRERQNEDYSTRTLDLDLLTYGALVGKYENIILPREEITQRAYILAPMAEIAGHKYFPGSNQTYQMLWNAFDKTKQPLKQIKCFWP